MSKSSKMNKIVENMQKFDKKEADKLYNEMKERCIPVVREVLSLVASGNLTLGDALMQHDEQGRMIPLPPGQRPKDYLEVAEKIQQLFLDKNLLWLERHIVFQIAKQPIALLENIVLSDLNTTFDRALCRVVGKALDKEVITFSELTFKEIDSLLRQFPREEKK